MIRKQKWLTAATLAVLLLGCDSQVPYEDLMARATQAVEAGKWSDATIDIKSALQQQPDSAAARALLGEVYLFQQQAALAAEEFERALRSEFEPATAELFARALFMAGEHQRLLDLHNERYFQEVESSAEYLAVLARSLGRLGEVDLAIETLAEARAAAPDNIYVRFTDAEFEARARQDFDGAATALEALVVDAPAMTEAWSLLGSVSLVQRNLERARDAFEHSIDLNPYRFTDKLNLAAILTELQRWDALQQQLDGLMRAAPQHPGVNYFRARLALQENQRDQALERLNAVLGVAPAHAPSLFLAAYLNAEDRNYATALNQIGTFLDLQPANVPGRLLLARIHLSEDKAEAAERVARTALEIDEMNLDTLKILGVALALQTAHAESADVYERILEIEPDAVENHLRLGTELTQEGDYQGAQAVLGAALERWPDDARVRIRVVRAHLAAEQYDEARRAAAGFLEAQPDNPTAHNLEGQAQLAVDNRDAARAAFEQALALDDSNRIARNALAGMAISEDNLGVAMRLYRDTLEADPGDLESLMRLASLQAYQQDLVGTSGTLREAVATNPEELLPRLALASVALNAGRPSEAVATLSEVRDSYRGEPRLHYLLARGFLALGQADSARNAVDRLLELAPEEPEYLRVAAAAASARGDYAGAEAFLRRALAASDNPALRAGLAETLFRQGKIADAKTEIGKLPPQVRAAEPVQFLEGSMALSQRDLQTAQQHFAAAYEAAPATRNVLALSATDWSLQAQDEAIARLRGWADDNPEDALVLNQLASYYIARGANTEAKAVYERLMAVAPESPVAMNNLAWLYREEDPDKALAYADRALRRAPDAAPILDTKAMILLHVGRHEEALRVIDDALAAAAENPYFLLHRAKVLAAMGRDDEARSIIAPLPEKGPLAYTEERAQLRGELADGP